MAILAASGIHLAELDDLALACAGAVPAQAAGLIRAGYRLLDASLPELDALLAAGGADAAALRLVEQHAGFMLSRSADGRCIATVALRGHNGEVTAEGACAALALMGALVGALAAQGRAGAALPRTGTPAAGLRLN